MNTDRAITRQALFSFWEQTQAKVDNLKDEYFDLKEAGKRDTAQQVLHEALEMHQVARQIKRVKESCHRTA